MLAAAVLAFRRLHHGLRGRRRCPRDTRSHLADVRCSTYAHIRFKQPTQPKVKAIHIAKHIPFRIADQLKLHRDKSLH